MSNFWAHISKKRKVQLSALILLTIFVSLTEIISIGAVLPFLGALTAPEKILEIQFLQPLFNKLNIPINKTVILQKKAVNKSVRLKNTMDYYNDETIKIVRQNDSLIFEKYRY